MTINLSAENGPVFLDFEIYRPLSSEDLTEVVNELVDDQSIQKISIEKATENPAVLELPKLRSKESIESGGQGGNPPSQTVKLDPEHPSPAERSRQPIDGEQAFASEIPQLRPGGDPFAIMRLLSHSDGWLRTAEIDQAIPPYWGVSANALGSNLWNLDERGLVEKRPYEEDNRQKEYKITDFGEQALQDALDRAGDISPIDPDD